MIQYFLYALCGTYYCTFIIMITHQLCKEYYEERMQRISEYRNLQTGEPSVQLHMRNEREYALQRTTRLETIQEDFSV